MAAVVSWTGCLRPRGRTSRTRFSNGLRRKAALRLMLTPWILYDKLNRALSAFCPESRETIFRNTLRVPEGNNCCRCGHVLNNIVALQDRETVDLEKLFALISGNMSASGLLLQITLCIRAVMSSDLKQVRSGPLHTLPGGAIRSTAGPQRNSKLGNAK